MFGRDVASLHHGMVHLTRFEPNSTLRRSSENGIILASLFTVGDARGDRILV